MIKVLVWRVTNDTSFQDDALKILERQHDGIEIIDGAADENISVFKNEFDIILVVGAKKLGMSKATKAARQLNLPEEKLLGDWIVCIPGFTLDKYRRLQKSRLSIFTMNCFGGLLLHTLGLPFRSPFVNMFFDEPDYLRFLREARSYIEEPLTFKETLYDTNLKKNYPYVALGEVNIHMNHYRDFEAALAKWNERKQKINWDNLFVTTYTESEEFAAAFDALPYDKKVCFVPFKSDLNSAWYIKNPKGPYWKTVNNFARGKVFYYDLFDMLLYGKKTPLIET